MAVFVGSIADLERSARTRRALLDIGVVLVALVAGVLAAAMASSGRLLAIPVLAAGLFPVAMWKVRHLGLIVLLAGATTVEQLQTALATSSLDPFTDRLALFHDISGLGLSPIELVIGAAVVVWLLRAANDGTLRVPRSHLGASMGVLAVLLVLGVVWGAVRGGDVHEALWELRPWAYIVILYLVGSQLLTDRVATHAVLWTLVLGIGLKAVQGAYLFALTHNLQPRPEALLGHEEAFFFGLFIVLAAGLWIFGVGGRLRATATALLPIVLVADLANNRRTAWLIAGAGLLLMVIVAYAVLPERRRLLRRIAAAISVVSVVYFPLYWNNDGVVAQPARAISSMLAPTPRDLSSNVYRLNEDANLRLNIQDAPLLGRGFGIPIDYRIPIVDLSGTTSSIRFIPHNGLLYVWMRMGAIGEAALWFMVAAAVIAGCRLATSRRREAALVGAVAVCAVAGWVIMGYADMGFDWLRIAVAMGVLLGLMQAQFGGAGVGGDPTGKTP